MVKNGETRKKLAKDCLGDRMRKRRMKMKVGGGVQRGGGEGGDRS